jgi:hypothetical protein
VNCANERPAAAAQPEGRAHARLPRARLDHSDFRQTSANNLIRRDFVLSRLTCANKMDSPTGRPGGETKSGADGGLCFRRFCFQLSSMINACAPARGRPNRKHRPRAGRRRRPSFIIIHRLDSPSRRNSAAAEPTRPGRRDKCRPPQPPAPSRARFGDSRRPTRSARRERRAVSRRQSRHDRRAPPRWAAPHRGHSKRGRPSSRAPSRRPRRTSAVLARPEPAHRNGGAQPQ